MGGKDKREVILKRKESDHIWRQSGKLKINLTYFTVLPRADLGAFISTTENGIFDEMFYIS